MKTVDVYGYDVWGNEEDGYTVNDSTRIGEDEYSNADFNNDDFLRQKAVDWFQLKPEIKDGIELDGDFEVVYFEYEGYPIGEFRVTKSTEDPQPWPEGDYVPDVDYE